MSGDFTRWTFDPKKNPAAVLMQQGRVQLDADWNEMVALFDRRLRAETADVVGRAVVPRETPTGFAITTRSGNRLSIGRGRMYVDGLLAENHGKYWRADSDTADPQLELDQMLGEVRGAQDVDYTQQPYPPKLLDLSKLDAGPHLVFLDVWRREVTALEDPTLIDPAVGVDTTVRWQTVWQVRLLPSLKATLNCASAGLDDRWLAETRPSNARLTTSLPRVAAPDDPCAIVPTVGYGGLENQLYRVEIHDVEPPAGAGWRASFKWSRDNGTVATTVQAVKDSDLELTWTRRDRVLAFAVGDWVEITDDAHELQGSPGLMAKVKEVHPDTRKITLEAPPPQDQFDTAHPTRLHMRVRRWDEKGQDVDSHGGLIPITLNTPITLEQGIQVTFSMDGPDMNFRPGDYWVFAARTADSSLESLHQAPPRGVHHHYARLALVTFPDTVTDCRSFWPPQTAGPTPTGRSECTVWVSADDHNSGKQTIQAAIDQVRDSGGRVCLGPGAFNLGAQPLNLKNATGVRMAGRGLNTVLLNVGAFPSIIVESAVGVAVERMTFVTIAGTQTEGIAISARNCSDLRVEGCAFLQHRPGIPPAPGGAPSLAAPFFLGPPVTAPSTNRAPAILLGGVVINAVIRDNVIVAGSGIANEEVFVVPEAAGVPPPEATPPTNGGILRLPPPLVVEGGVGVGVPAPLWAVERRIPVDLGPAGVPIGTGTPTLSAPGEATAGGLAGGAVVGRTAGLAAMRGMTAPTETSHLVESATPGALAGRVAAPDAGVSIRPAPTPAEPPSAAPPPVPPTGPGVPMPPIAPPSIEPPIAGPPPAAPPPAPPGVSPVVTPPIEPDRYLMTAGLFVDANTLLCRFRGMSFDGMCFHIGETRIAGNHVEGERDAGLAFTGMVSQGSRLDIRDNSVRAGAHGIVCGTDRARIQDNDIAPVAGGKGGCGIVLLRGLDPAGIQTVEVMANRIDRMAVRGISIQGPVGDATVQDNRIEGTGLGGIIMEAGSTGKTVLVARNRLINIAPATNEGGRAIASISLAQSTRADVVENVVIGMGTAAAQGISRTGVVVAGCASVRIAGNELVHVGPSTEFLGDAAGIIVLTPFDRVDVLDNIVRRGDQAPSAPPVGSAWRGISVGSAAENAPEILPGGLNVLRVGTATAFLTGDAVAVISRGLQIVSVRGNLIDGYGNAALLTVNSGGSCTISENRCVRFGPAPIPTVTLNASALIVTSNVVHGEPAGTPSIQLQAGSPAAVVGNIVSGPILVGTSPLDGGWAALNPIGS